MRQELGNLTVKAEVQEEDPDSVHSLHDVVNRYESLKNEQKEHLYAVFLTNGNRFIGDKIIGLGSREHVRIDGVAVMKTFIKEWKVYFTVKEALQRNLTQVIHNVDN